MGEGVERGKVQEWTEQIMTSSSKLKVRDYVVKWGHWGGVRDGEEMWSAWVLICLFVYIIIFKVGLGGFKV